MANYITRPAIDRRAGKTDIEQLMPYLQNELATVRTNDNAKIATLQKMEANALANPDAYRGTEFHIANDGFVNMNEKAKGLMRPKDGIDYSQDAINESSDVINRELTDQLTTDAIGKIANTEERRTAAADAKNIGQLDKAKLAQLALDGKDSQGNDLLKDIATPTPPATQPTEGDIANTSNTPPTQPTAGTGYNPATGTLSQNIAYMAGVTPDPNIKSPATSATQPDPNFTGPTLTAEQIAANNPTKSNSDVLKTGTAAEKANELAKQNPGMGGKATDKNAASKGSGMSKNWTVTTDIGVGKSNIKTDAVHDIKTTQRAGIIDQDAVDLKSLKVAAGLEDILNSAKAGRPGAAPMTAMANRLAQREAFLTDIQNKRGVVTSTKQTGGNVDAGLGEMNAKFTSKTGVDSYTNISNSTSSTGAVQVDKGGDPNPNAKKFVALTTDGKEATYDRIQKGNSTVINSNSRNRQTLSLKYEDANSLKPIYSGAGVKQNANFRNSVGEVVKQYIPAGWKGAWIEVNKATGKPYFASDGPFEIPESDFTTYVEGGGGDIEGSVNARTDRGSIKRAAQNAKEHE